MNKKDVKVVTIGGGTGSFMLLSALKNYVSDLTAVVNMVDDGGSTGILRDELGALPPGDVRKCLVALSTSSQVVRDLFSYRFDEGRGLSGHSFGNLFLSALEKVTGSFAEAIETAGQVLAIKGKILPVTLESIKLVYVTPDGDEVVGEHRIGDTAILKNNKKPFLELRPKASLNPQAREAIIKADIVIIAPGTLYGSLTPALMVGGVKEALAHSKAHKVYVANLMTMPETQGYTLGDFTDELERFAGGKFIDEVLYNSGRPPEAVLRHYLKESEEPLELGDLSGQTYKIMKNNYLAPIDDDDDLIRHDADKVAQELLKKYSN